MIVVIVCVLFGVFCVYCFFFFFKQKTAYEMRISDWSSDVCSSDLLFLDGDESPGPGLGGFDLVEELFADDALGQAFRLAATRLLRARGSPPGAAWRRFHRTRSEEHTSELQSLMRSSYAVFCLKKKNNS